MCYTTPTPKEARQRILNLSNGAIKPDRLDELHDETAVLLASCPFNESPGTSYRNTHEGIGIMLNDSRKTTERAAINEIKADTLTYCAGCFLNSRCNSSGIPTGVEGFNVRCEGPSYEAVRNPKTGNFHGVLFPTTQVLGTSEPVKINWNKYLQPEP